MPPPANAVRVIALLSRKGGVGKSMLARQLAALAALTGPAALADLDQQGTSAGWLARRDAARAAGNFRVGPGPAAIRPAYGLTLPDRPALAELFPGGGYIFADTRPDSSAREAAAAGACDLAIIPMQPTADDLLAIRDTLATLRRHGRPGAIVLNRVRGAGRADQARAALAAHGLPVCPHTLGERVALHDAALLGLAAHELPASQGSTATAELAAIWNWIKEGGAHHGAW